ncbi:hypothetical protein [Rhizobium sp. L1K21]|uniref:hypothetical protein n=1 Tax=Rhizobium sp. L1K21 TaxID=2954933 RepID=UPI00209322EF|nr:hypothetical protein [Rhizobium sp. L1K21]MCO6188047.1 hypothetical protein [Rhizobium sp. L1K21]
MKKYALLLVAVFMSLAQVFPVHAAGESSLISALPSFRSDPASLKKVVVAAKSAGWTVPTQRTNNVPINGTWKFSTYKGETGTVTFSSGKITYGSGNSKGAFTAFSFMSNKSEPDTPILVVLKSGSKSAWYIPFVKGGQRTFLNFKNKRQWITLYK